MRTICDACESAAAIVFCAADEAALCRSCDDKVHSCNKLASRHVRVRLAEPSDIPRCDICEKEPAFFYCEIDGTSLCLQCDMIVHVGVKRTHGRYLLLRQRVEFPGSKPGHVDEPVLQPSEAGEASVDKNYPPKPMMRVNHPSHRISSVPSQANNGVGVSNNLFDLNSRPHRMHELSSNNLEQGMDISNEANNEPVSVVPVAPFQKELEK